MKKIYKDAWHGQWEQELRGLLNHTQDEMLESFSKEKNETFFPSFHDLKKKST